MRKRETKTTHKEVKRAPTINSGEQESMGDRAGVAEQKFDLTKVKWSAKAAKPSSILGPRIQKICILGPPDYKHPRWDLNPHLHLWVVCVKGVRYTLERESTACGC